MKRVVRAEEMKACDGRMIHEIGVPSLVLMERAASEVVSETIRRVSIPAEQLKVLAVCGSGNNGGDGFACARIFHIMGASAAVLFTGNEAHLSEETRSQREICHRLGIPEYLPDQFPEVSFDVIIDAVFGIGLSRAVSGASLAAVQWMNRQNSFVTAVDIPSGVHADTGQIMGDAVKADLTVSMEFLKPGLLLYPGAEYAGEVVDAEIGIQEIPSDTPILLPEETDLKQDLPPRQKYGNKGTFGKLLICAGSYNMSGAAFFSAKAALRTGAGMVKLLTTEENRHIIQQMLPEVMLSTYQTAEEAAALLERDLDWCDAVAAGPGMGNTDRTGEIVRYLIEHSDRPLLLDADALNVLSDQPELLRHARHVPAVTPHMGEMGRLSGIPVSTLKQDPVGAAETFSKQYRTALVMKDARTVTAYPDGRTYINRYGNSGMAAAGSGDVLSGIAGALMARAAVSGQDANRYLYDAVLLHALAGDAAAELHGETSMTASDIIDGIEIINKKVTL